MTVRGSGTFCRRAAVLAVLLPALLGGCAAGRRQLPSAAGPVAAGEAPAVTGPTVARLDGGREGFVIREAPALEERSRDDFARAVAMLNREDHAAAIELLLQVIEASPGVSAPYINIAIAYRLTGRPEEAERHLRTAMALIPDHPAAGNEYGLLLRQSGRFAEARTVYEQVLAAYPDYHPARRNLGILCDLYLHDLECALEQYQIYSAAMPDNEPVRRWIVDLKQRLKR